ncbi:hypothetical protein LTR56_025433 [Elasticomyces elasticus]|nr:hypothetical protein LTR56_025433 [Elasticomyces elasticus]KAK3652003.1 hypothetical protein LTR22_011933 [Elasticomyces elasticus]KAK4919044.1 hypothetical protein LTR49_013215 [Elasticomyces elasticus]KAK5738982.1 hypothetical protein LTS12_025416 [Elasticomyces elasticus]
MAKHAHARDKQLLLTQDDYSIVAESCKALWSVRRRGEYILNSTYIAMSPHHHDYTPSPSYHDLAVDTNLGNASVHYIEAGSVSKPTVLLLHGFPSSSNQFRDLVPLLSDSYHVLAPDLPGFGLTKVPEDFVYTFDALTTIIAAWLIALNVTRYAVYIFDYGAPVGLRLALQNPDHIAAIISQNGNAYDSGFGQPFWEPIMALWNETNPNSEADRDSLRAFYLQIGGTDYQYTTGVPEGDLKLVNPVAAQIDYYLNLEGRRKQDVQLDLFYDYRNTPPLYPKVQEYFRKSQVPLLAAWGKGDPVFIPPGAEDFKKDLPDAEIHLLDAGHFALETKRWEIAALMKKFLKTVKF